MDPKPAPIRAVLLLGASFIGLGGMLWLWSLDEPLPPGDVVVHQRIIAPDGQRIFNGTLTITAGNGTVLGALVRASEVGGFEINVTHAHLGKAFVQSIAGIHNQGSCGWVYDHNNVRGARAVDEEVLADQDQIRWGWDCEG